MDVPVIIEKFRIDLLDHQCLETMVHFGRGLFGSDFGSVGFTFCNRAAPDDHVSVFRRLFERHVEVRSIDVIRRLFLNAEYGRYETKQSVFDLIPGRPIVYWASLQMLKAFSVGTPLGETAVAKVGLQTGDNERFLRQWFEVSADRSCMRACDREDARASGARWFRTTRAESSASGGVTKTALLTGKMMVIRFDHSLIRRMVSCARVRKILTSIFETVFPGRK